MDDEVHEAHCEAFDYIVFALTLIGLVGGGLAFGLDGLASVWFLRALALLSVLFIAFVLRRAGQFVVAGYVLVLELIGLVVGAFLQTDAFTTFIPYLFIPVIIIASLILSLPATVIMALFSIILALLMMAVTGQFSLANLLALMPAFSLLLLTTLLATLSGRYIAKIDHRLLDSTKLLRERTLELLKALEDAQTLQTHIENLKAQVGQAKSETHRTHQLTTQRDQQLSGLVEGAIRELKVSVKKLEQAVEALAEVPGPSTPTKLLPQAWQQIDHLTSLVIGLEAMIQLEHHDFRLDIQTIDLSQLLGEIVQIGRGLARDKNLELRYTVPPNLPLLPVDPAQLRQALLHLLNNAIKYTNQGLIEVQAEQSGSELTIFISDTGIGLSDKELKTIFQPFKQDQNGSAHQRSGTGLSLPLSKRIIELHGGRLWATSVLGVGSTFCVALPLEEDTEKTQLNLSAVTLPATPTPNRQPQLSIPVSSLNQGEPVPAAPHFKTPVPATPEPANQTSVNFGPVARFSPIYISRFGLTLLSLFLLIIGLILTLALVNGFTPTQARITLPTLTASPLNIASKPSASPTQSVAQAATTPSPTATSLASPTLAQPTIASTIPTATSPKIFQESLPSPTPTRKPTLTPTITPTLLPTSRPTPTPTPLPIATPQPVSDAAEPAAVGRPTLAPVPLIDLVDYPLLAKQSFEAAPNTRLTVTTNPAAVGGLTWLRTESGYQPLFSGDLGSSNRDLYLATGADNQPINLTQAAGDDLQPAISPDNQHIAFSSGRTGNLDIYLMDVNGDNLTQLTDSRGFDEWPAWSPDGQQIAFVSDRDGNVELYSMNRDGSNQQRLTNHPADDWPVVWSPDRDNLLFSSNRDGNWNLYLLELKSGVLTRLTNDPGDEREPVWSPDGRTIAFAYNDGTDWDVYTLPAPSGAPAEVSSDQWTQITTSSKDQRYPAWLP